MSKSGFNLKKIKNNIIFAGAVVVFGLARKLPRKIGLFLFGKLGAITFLFPDKEKNRTIEHLGFIYGKEWNERRIRKTAAKVYSNLGKNLFDAFYLSNIAREKIDRIVKHDDLSEFRSAYEKGKGVIAITAHTGCFEMLLHFFGLHGFTSFAVGRRLYDPRIDRLIRNARSGDNIEYMERSESTIKIVRNLNAGKLFGVLIDQDTNVAGVFADFLGVPAYTPSGPIKMAMKFKIPVFVVTTARQNNDTHHVYLSKQLSLIDTGNFEFDLVKNVEIANRCICETIKKYPEQWVWMHRRWHRKIPIKSGTAVTK